MPQGPLTAQPNLPRRGEPSSAAPGPQPDHGAPQLAALSACFRSVLTVRMLSRLLFRTHFLCLFLSPSLSLSNLFFPPCLSLCSSFQWRKIIILLNGFARGARTQARAHTHTPPWYPINAQIFGVPLTSADDSES